MRFSVGKPLQPVGPFLEETSEEGKSNSDQKVKVFKFVKTPPKRKSDKRHRTYSADD